MVGSLRNLFYIIMIIFVPLYKLKSMRSSSVCENLHTYLWNVVSPAGHQLQKRGAFELQTPTTGLAKSGQDKMFADKNKPKKSQDEKHLGEWLQLITPFHYQWAESLKVRHLHFGGNHCYWFVEVLSLSFSGVKKKECITLLIALQRKTKETGACLSEGTNFGQKDCCPECSMWDEVLSELPRSSGRRTCCHFWPPLKDPLPAFPFAPIWEAGVCMCMCLTSSLTASESLRWVSRRLISQAQENVIRNQNFCVRLKFPSFKGDEVLLVIFLTQENITWRWLALGII